MIKLLTKYLILLCFGGGIYYSIELLWRSHSHWSMFLTGGLCFIICGLLNEIWNWDTKFWKQVLIGDLCITFIEFCVGCVVNLWLGLAVWDYSQMPLNLLGQICVPFMLLWIPLVIVAIVVDDYLRYWWFKEEKPHYKWF